MITSLILALQFIVGIGKRLATDAYYRSLGLVMVLLLLIGTLFVWLVGQWPFTAALLYAVTTMSMNTPYGGPLMAAAGLELVFFHMVYTFLSVGVFLVFAIETGKTMLANYDESKQKMAARKAQKAGER